MQDLTKVCSKCGIKKDLCDFGKNKTGLYGVRECCKVCIKQYMQDYYKKNKKVFKEKCISWNKNNPDRKNENSRNWKRNNRQKASKSYATYRNNNLEKLRELARKWHKNNFEKSKLNASIYRLNNSEKIKEVRELLPDSYIKTVLKKQNYPQELINNPEFIEVKRLIIKTKRLCRTSRN